MQRVVESEVNVDITVVFAKPQLNAGLVGVLHRFDIVVIKAEQTSASTL